MEGRVEKEVGNVGDRGRQEDIILDGCRVVKGRSQWWLLSLVQLNKQGEA